MTGGFWHSQNVLYLYKHTRGKEMIFTNLWDENITEINISGD